MSDEFDSALHGIGRLHEDRQRIVEARRLWYDRILKFAREIEAPNNPEYAGPLDVDPELRVIEATLGTMFDKLLAGVDAKLRELMRRASE